MTRLMRWSGPALLGVLLATRAPLEKNGVAFVPMQMELA